MGLLWKFSVSWNGGGTSATRLKDWLDPLNSGKVTAFIGRGGSPGRPGPSCRPTFLAKTAAAALEGWTLSVYTLWADLSWLA